MVSRLLVLVSVSKLVVSVSKVLVSLTSLLISSPTLIPLLRRSSSAGRNVRRVQSASRRCRCQLEPVTTLGRQSTLLPGHDDQSPLPSPCSCGTHGRPAGQRLHAATASTSSQSLCPSRWRSIRSSVRRLQTTSSYIKRGNVSVRSSVTLGVCKYL